MAKGLFAKEDDGSLGMGEEVLETGAEVGEVADAIVDAEPEMAAVTEEVTDIDAGVVAGEQLGEAESILEEAVESGEGLPPVAVEAIQFGLRALCRPIGANPKTMYALYAKESFASDSSRLANTQFALEGVREFAKDLYKKIKAALERLWKKMKAFWDKHISNLGRVKKAVESMKSKVKSSTGKLKGTPFLETMPSGLADAFRPSGALELADIDKAVTDHTTFTTAVGATLEQFKPSALLATDQATFATSITNFISAKLANGTGENVLVTLDRAIGGDTVKAFVDSDMDDGAYKLEFRVEREADDKLPEVDTSKGMNIPTKEKLVGLLDATLKLVKTQVDARKKYDKNQTEIAKSLQAFAGAWDDKKDSNTTTAQTQKFGIQAMYKMSSFSAKLSSLSAGESIRCAKAVLSYANTCVGQYK